MKAINEAFSFEEDLQEIAEAQESFMAFFEEKLMYVSLSIVPLHLPCNISLILKFTSPCNNSLPSGRITCITATLPDWRGSRESGAEEGL